MTKTLLLNLLQVKVSVGEADEFIAFLGLRLGRKKMGRDFSLPCRLATQGGAQVALQHCLILRPSAPILSLNKGWKHNPCCVPYLVKKTMKSVLVSCL